jgi:hypothetical protein
MSAARIADNLRSARGGRAVILAEAPTGIPQIETDSA